MKFEIRTPNIKKSIKARTTGKAKRAVKKALIPGYGKKFFKMARLSFMPFGVSVIG